MEKDLVEVNFAIEEAAALGERENEDILAAEDKMEKTTAALDEAIIVLKEATAGHEEGVLVQVKRAGLATNEGFAQPERRPLSSPVSPSLVTE